MNHLRTAAACALACMCGLGMGQTPLGTAFTYQGELRNNGELATGLHDLRFRLFDAAVGGSQVGSTLCADDVGVAGGHFTVRLDFGVQFDGQQRFLAIDVRTDAGLPCANSSGFTPLLPRQELSAAPNAVFALNAATATPATTATNATQFNGQAASFYQDAGNLNAGSLPSARLAGAYTGALTFNNASNAFTGSGAGLTTLNASNLTTGTLSDARLSGNVSLLSGVQTFSGAKTFSVAPAFSAASAPFSVTSTTPVSNLNADLLDGLHATAFLQTIPNPLTLSGNSASHIIRGENASTSAGTSGVQGLSTGASGATYGAFGLSSSTSGRGVYGLATATSGATYGGEFESASTGGVGVYAHTSAGTGGSYGIWSQSQSTSGTGVFGWVPAVSGTTRGVYGRSDSITGTGVFGWATANGALNYGGRFQCDSQLGVAVYGLSSDTLGSGLAGQFVSNAEGGTGVRGESVFRGGYFIASGSSGMAVSGLASATTSGTTYGGRFESLSRFGRGVYGLASDATGINHGVFGESTSTSGIGVNGLASASTGSTIGVQGITYSTGGYGMFGWANTASGSTFGVYGLSESTSGQGVHGRASASSGTTYGVYGEATGTSGTNYGGYFEAAGSTARAVYGRASGTGGTNYGGYFEAAGTTARGIYARASAATGSAFAVHGESTSTSGRGVMGYATASSGTTYGVGGSASSGYGLYSWGAFGASGTKSFRIDHPDDPENKYLLHYCTESPEVLNAYSGTIVLDGAGEAVVELPRYFAKINTRPRYQLTAVGAPMPMLHVAEEIDEAALSGGVIMSPSDVAPLCFFRIAGGTPGAKVSWEVKAVRNDRWVRQHGAPTDVEKLGPEKGTYQHPELYDLPLEKGVNYEAPTSGPETVTKVSR